MRIWSILLINSDLKWCIDFGRSLFLNIIVNSIKEEKHNPFKNNRKH